MKEEIIEAHGVRLSTPTLAIDALMEMKNRWGKKKGEQRKKQGAGPQLSYSGPFGRLLQPAGIIR